MSPRDYLATTIVFHLPLQRRHIQNGGRQTIYVVAIVHMNVTLALQRSASNRRQLSKTAAVVWTTEIHFVSPTACNDMQSETLSESARQ